jgi:hypothetical protein
MTVEAQYPFSGLERFDLVWRMAVVRTIQLPDGLYDSHAPHEVELLRHEGIPLIRGAFGPRRENECKIIPLLKEYEGASPLHMFGMTLERLQ